MKITRSDKFTQIIDETDYGMEEAGRKFASDFEYRFEAFALNERVRFIKKLRQVMKGFKCESFRFHTFGGISGSFRTQNPSVRSWFELASRQVLKIAFPGERVFLVTQDSVKIAHHDDGKEPFCEYLYDC